MLTLRRLVVFWVERKLILGRNHTKDSPFCILRFCEASEKVYRLTGARWLAIGQEKGGDPYGTKMR